MESAMEGEEAENSMSEASEEEQGEEEVSPDEERDEKLDGGDSEGEPAQETGRKKRKRKRSKHQPGHRRVLRSKYESVEDFNPDARSAQTEELERIRRLELQQSLLDDSITSSVSEREEESIEGALNGENSASQEAVVVDLTEVIEEDETKADAIVIESGSESEGEEGRTGKRAKVNSTASAVKRSVRRLNRKYDVIDPLPDGRVLVNVGHAPEEEDVFLPPHLAAVVKPHQVGFHMYEEKHEEYITNLWNCYAKIYATKSFTRDFLGPSLCKIKSAPRFTP